MFEDPLLTFEQPVAAGLTAGDHRQGQLCQLSPPASDPAKMTQAAGRQLSLHTQSHPASHGSLEALSLASH